LPLLLHQLPCKVSEAPLQVIKERLMAAKYPSAVKPLPQIFYPVTVKGYCFTSRDTYCAVTKNLFSTAVKKDISFGFCWIHTFHPELVHKIFRLFVLWIDIGCLHSAANCAVILSNSVKTAGKLQRYSIITNI